LFHSKREQQLREKERKIEQQLFQKRNNSCTFKKGTTVVPQKGTIVARKRNNSCSIQKKGQQACEKTGTTVVPFKKEQQAREKGNNNCSIQKGTVGV
jgi:hypothetical protein